MNTSPAVRRWYIPRTTRREVSELRAEPVAVRLQQVHDPHARPEPPERLVDLQEIALEDGEPGRGEDHPTAVERQEREEQAEDAQEAAGQPVLQGAHSAVTSAGGR